MERRKPASFVLSLLRHLPFFLFVVLILSNLGFSGFTGCEAQESLLPPKEVEALKQIALKLGKQWNFSEDPCSGAPGWVDPPTSNTNVVSNLSCTCDDRSVCHVTKVQLKGQNLTGSLPDEFAVLTYLTVLDLTRNYLNGTIPVSWATLPLTNLSLLGNRVTGNIPAELGQMTTLIELVLDANQLQGTIPPELGNLKNLKRLLVSSNNISGELPEELGNLQSLLDFRIDGNPISGKIPSFVGNWTQLQRLYLLGTSLEGPFPPGFSNLTSLFELRVSDWKGSDGAFPPIGNMTRMQYLVLRNLSISGQLPDYLPNMGSLNSLDLSFNHLSGEIPYSYYALAQSINFMYLTNNKLNGSIPGWILSSKQNMDLSYNNFTGVPTPSNCEQGNVNLVASYSTADSNLISPCLLSTFPCSGKAKNYNLFIKCGGNSVIINGNEYEDDSSQLGASRFAIASSGKWASSSTGDFMNNVEQNYVAKNSSVLNLTNPELYMTARLNPLSLRYYGLCLQNGNYTVNLHFAEIIFTNDQTYASVGRRIFDVYIQGHLVLQDFNIVEDAKGMGKATVKNFTASVIDNTLEIHFQWVGKGTDAIPVRGVYGPLVSAISVTPNFKPDLGDNGSGLSTVAIVLIVASSSVVIIFIIGLLLFFLKRRDTEIEEFKGLELQTGYFSLRQIKAATKNFDPTNKIGEGGFGPVYKGVLPDGSMIAVKQLSSKSKQGNREFVNEIGMISALQHPNLVKLLGCCVQGNQLLLIYEYMENNSLARALFGPVNTRLNLDWSKRCKICLGIAQGLAFLHEESRLKVVHRDIKATNVLLDKGLNAKISDFGLAKLSEEGDTHISTRIAGTIGYMAPEYAMRGYLTDKADVYSFGVVVLEIVSGMSNTNYRPTDDFVYLLDWAYVLQERGDLLELVDTNLGSEYNKEEAVKILKIALLCTNPSPTLRPTMSKVVSMLDSSRPIPSSSAVRGSSSSIVDARFKSLERQANYDSLEAQWNSNTSEELPWINSYTTPLSSTKEGI